MLLLGYNSNGFPFHRWPDGLALAAEIGYRSVAITVDHHWLDPYGPRLEEEIERTRAELELHGLRSVVETGARFLLNPRAKHEPTLMSRTAEERAVRVDFLQRCIDLAAALRSDAVSFWSGVLREPLDFTAGMQRLVEGVRPVVDFAGERKVRLAFEPEPGMFVERVDEYVSLLEWIEADGHEAAHLGVTLDVGHLQCSEEREPAAYVHQCADRLFNVHVEDMVRGVHEHLRFGDGEIDFAPLLRALVDVGYANGVHVELSRHGHVAPEVMRESFDFLTGLLNGIET
jgi:L-ribulose-5-phosphate 3-epimerase